MNNAEKVRRQNRKRIKIRVRMSVEYVEGPRLKYTCRTCGWSVIQYPGGKAYERLHGSKRAISTELVKKLAAYQDQGGGASGFCPQCTKRERDRQYPKGWGPLGPQRQ